MVYQLGTALLDALVLASVEREDMYGYMISQRIKSVVSQKESTLYPVLRRLLEAGYLVTYDQAYQGRNRRYYQITEAGREQLSDLRREWKTFTQAAENILLGGNEHE